MNIFGGKSAVGWMLGRNPHASVGTLALLAEVDRGQERRGVPQESREDRERCYEIELKEARRKREIMLRSCERATPADLAEWMRGYRARGGLVSDVLDAEMRGWYVMRRRPALLVELYGALSVNVIVPEGILSPNELPRTFHDASGHSSWHFMEGFRFVGTSGPVSYEHVEALLAGTGDQA